MKFERIFKYHEKDKSFIARVFIRLPIYHMTEKIANLHLSDLLSANHVEVIMSVEK